MIQIGCALLVLLKLNKEAAIHDDLIALRKAGGDFIGVADARTHRHVPPFKAAVRPGEINKRKILVIAQDGRNRREQSGAFAVGMKQRDFLSIAMAGKKEQGMPAWAGFLTEDDVVGIFRYVKGRSLDLVSSGRPPSAQD